MQREKAYCKTITFRKVDWQNVGFSSVVAYCWNYDWRSGKAVGSLLLEPPDDITEPCRVGWVRSMVMAGHCYSSNREYVVDMIKAPGAGDGNAHTAVILFAERHF
jgi:hypothetical protein